MKTKLIELATSKQIGFISQMFTDTNWKHSIKEDLRYYLWMCELQKWCRNKYSKHITIFSSSQESWMFRITIPHQKLEDGKHGEDFYTYEQALEEGLYQTLLLIQEESEKGN